MNFYLVECEYPKVKMRHYKNSRVADYTKDQLNNIAGYTKYMVTSDNDVVHVVLTRDMGYPGVNPLK